MKRIFSQFASFWVGLVFLVSILPLHAQDDPFATQPAKQDPFSTTGQATNPSDPQSGNATGQPPIPADVPDSTRLVIESIQKSNPTTANDFGYAIRTMLDIEQYDHAKYYLGRLNERLQDDVQRFEFQMSTGSDLLLEIQTHPSMQPEGQQFAQATLTGAARAAYAPARLDKLVRDLSNSNSSVSASSFRQLRRLEAPAVAALIKVFSDESRLAEFSAIRSALVQMGDSAIEPLVGSARANQARIQFEAIRALGHFDTNEASDALLRAYLSPKFPESLRRLALDRLMARFGKDTDPVQAENTLYQRAMNLLTGQTRLLESDVYSRTLWRWNNNSRQLEPWILDAVTVAQIKAADRAADLLEINPDSARYRELFLLTQLESSKRLLGPSNTLEHARLERLLSKLEWEEIDAILARAMRLNLVPAACGACELLGQVGSPKTVVHANGGQSNLVKALLSGHRNLQFAAFQAISKINPETAFNGSSYMTAAAAFIAQGGGQPKALIGHRATHMARSFAATLSQVGLVGVAASNSRDFFHRAIADPDLELLVISDTLHHPDPIGLFQQLRSDWRTKNLPIIVAVSNENSRRRMERLFHREENVSIFAFTLDPALIHADIAEAKRLDRSWTITSSDRRRQSMAAINWLGEVASNRTRYDFYELGRHEEALTQLIYVPGFSNVAAKVLSALGTPAAQREMLNFANQANLPLEERKTIAEAFIESVNRSGTLLTAREIQMQYDRYNAAEYEPQPNQELLSSILDAIEARARSRQQEN